MKLLSKKHARTLVLTSIGLLFFLQAFAPNAVAQRLVYHVDLTHTDKHYVDVNVQLLDVRPDTLVFQMPVWSPGIYSTVQYGRFLSNVHAQDSTGQPIAVEHPDRCLWKVPNAGAVARFSYRVEDSHSDDRSPEIGLARIDEHGLFAHSEALFGYFDNDESIPATIIFDIPKDWMIATTLDPATDGSTNSGMEFHQTVFDADDYSDIANSPLILAPKFEAASFTRDGVQYAVVIDGSANFPADSFASAANQIARVESSFFGKVPYDRYLFVVDAGSREPFGIAHCSSSVYTLPVSDWPTEEQAIQQLVAATLFKTWNGERFHISQLGPVDYTSPIEARSLWFTEGVSEYYSQLLRVRYGLITLPEFFAAIDAWQSLAAEADTATLESLSTHMQSFDAAHCVSLRARGALAALTMDIEIRDKTKCRRSLDNVLLRMDRDAPSGRTYDDAKFAQTLSKYAGVDLADFCDRYVHHADVLPVEAYLEKMGAGGEVPASMRGSAFSIDVALNVAGTAIIDAPPVDTLDGEEAIADNACPIELKTGDTVSAIDGEHVSAESLADATVRLKTGRSVKLTLVHNAKPMGVTLRAKKTPTHAIKFASLPNATPGELALRSAMIGKRSIKKVHRPKLYAQSGRGTR